MKPMLSKANRLSNGMGGQSMFMLHLAAERIIPATITITANTGWEKDRVCSTGERMSADAFFERHVRTYAEAHGIEAIYVRSVDENGDDLKDLVESVMAAGNGTTTEEMMKGMCIPLFTKDRTNGRLRQSCTDKWKIRAINQEARRRGIGLLRTAIGYHAGECHRLKARYISDDGGYSIYKPQATRDGKTVDVRWLEHYYPLIDMGLNREDIRARLVKVGLPFLVTTECDGCPHQDYGRWIMHTQEVIDDLSKLEARWLGKLFFTDKRIPLKDAIEEMRLERIEKDKQEDLPAFGCENGAYCGI